MLELAKALRFMQLFAHNLHNTASGETFFQDHAFLGDLYPQYEGHYDDIIERIIGLGGKVDFIDIVQDVLEEMKAHKDVKAAKDGLKILLEYEKAICTKVKEEIKGSSPGTEQLIGEIANKSEIRQYLIKQRLS